MLSIICWLKISACFAGDKFEILPDLPDPLAAYAQTAEASSVSTTGNAVSILGSQSIGHEPNLLSVIFSLLIVIVLIYLTQILYTKLNKANINLVKNQRGAATKSQASVISTTALGNNKTLHVIELDGKRMLIGASSGAIQLIKDLGSVEECDDIEEFSHIEIPTIKIPKIEIPKIEIPSIGFSKLATKIHKESEKSSEIIEKEGTTDVKDEALEQNSDVIIDSLFTKQSESLQNEQEDNNSNVKSEHTVDPDEFALYKKYMR